MRLWKHTHPPARPHISARSREQQKKKRCMAQSHLYVTREFGAEILVVEANWRAYGACSAPERVAEEPARDLAAYARRNSRSCFGWQRDPALPTTFDCREAALSTESPACEAVLRQTCPGMAHSECAGGWLQRSPGSIRKRLTDQRAERGPTRASRAAAPPRWRSHARLAPPLVSGHRPASGQCQCAELLPCVIRVASAPC